MTLESAIRGVISRKTEKEELVPVEESYVEESSSEWAKSLETIAKKKQLDKISDKDKELLIKLAAMMKKESVELDEVVYRKGDTVLFYSGKMKNNKPVEDKGIVVDSNKKQTKVKVDNKVHTIDNEKIRGAVEESAKLDESGMTRWIVTPITGKPNPKRWVSTEVKAKSATDAAKLGAKKMGMKPSDVTSVKKFVGDFNESVELDEAFEVGDSVMCKASGMEGEVVGIEGNSIKVEREDGKTMMYSPNELKDLEDSEEDELEEDYYNVIYRDKEGKVQGEKRVGTKSAAEKLAKLGNSRDKVGGTYTVTLVRGRNEEVELGEARQMKDPKKDSMVQKGGKTIVIDKSKEKEYLKKGWQLAEKKKLDSVDPKAVKKDFDDRKDKDIDNDGDVDDSDEYLHNRRKAISKAISKESKKEKDSGKEAVDTSPTLDEEMTDEQKKKREEIVLSMKKKMPEFKAKYGDRAKDVMYATATKLAMKEGISVSEEAFSEIINK